MIVVVSTGLRSPNRDRCMRSVAEQTVAHRHHYIEAADQDPPRNSTENRYRVIHTLVPEDIVVEVDGDDWLAHYKVLETVAALYEDPAVWLTWGSFVHSDGRPGFCRDYTPGESYRRSAWRASHLKTFRAGLYQLIPREALQGPGGGFGEHARDLLTMVPMLEMAGPEHSRFCANTLYVYDLAASYEWNTDAAGMAAEREAVDFVRTRPELARLTERPW